MSARRGPLHYLTIGALVLTSAGSAVADDFLDSLMRVLGISATPSLMKGDGEVTAGQVWMMDLERGTRIAITADGDYHWPLYEPSGQALIALKGDKLVRIPLKADAVKVLHKIPALEKLVGFDRQDADKVLVVLKNDDTPLALLSLKTGKLVDLPYDPKSKDHRRMLSHVKGEQRVFGSTRVYVETESKQGMEGPLEWSDVYLQQSNAAPRNISNCAGVNCGQPALSPDGKSVIYVRSNPRTGPLR